MFLELLLLPVSKRIRWSASSATILWKTLVQRRTYNTILGHTYDMTNAYKLAASDVSINDD